MSEKSPKFCHVYRPDPFIDLGSGDSRHPRSIHPVLRLENPLTDSTDMNKFFRHLQERKDLPHPQVGGYLVIKPEKNKYVPGVTVEVYPPYTNPFTGEENSAMIEIWKKDGTVFDIHATFTDHPFDSSPHNYLSKLIGRTGVEDNELIRKIIKTWQYTMSIPVLLNDEFFQILGRIKIDDNGLQLDCDYGVPNLIPNGRLQGVWPNVASLWREEEKYFLETVIGCLPFKEPNPQAISSKFNKNIDYIFLGVELYSTDYAVLYGRMEELAKQGELNQETIKQLVRPYLRTKKISNSNKSVGG